MTGRRRDNAGQHSVVIIDPVVVSRRVAGLCGHGHSVVDGPRWIGCPHPGCWSRGLLDDDGTGPGPRSRAARAYGRVASADDPLTMITCEPG